MDQPRSVAIWDPLVRVCHWTLAAAVITDYWVTEPGGDVHDWIGYLAAAVVLTRIVWGFAGRGYARFDSFAPDVQNVREHLRMLSARRLPLDSGHNPLGALMIYAVFVLVAALTITGWLHEEVDVLFGNEWLQTVHELAAHLLWIAVLLHVASVLVVQHFGRIELIRPMITGRRRPWV